MNYLRRLEILKELRINAAIDYEMENIVFYDELSSAHPRENAGSISINIGISF
jgi:hypothetical protein